MPETFPEDVDATYATFSGMVGPDASQRFFHAFGMMLNASAKRVHLLIHSAGGNVSDGIAIYNFLTNMPIEIITYNVGAVESIAVLVYLTGKVRKASRNASFLIHKTRFGFVEPATAEMLRRRADGAELSDKNTDLILREHIVMPDHKWAERDRADLILSAEEAKEFTLVHEIADFVPPPGCKLFSI